MNSGSKLAAFAGVLALSFGAAAALGAAVGPIDTDTTPSHPADHQTPADHTGHDTIPADSDG